MEPDIEIRNCKFWVVGVAIGFGLEEPLNGLGIIAGVGVGMIVIFVCEYTDKINK